MTVRSFLVFALAAGAAWGQAKQGDLCAPPPGAVPPPLPAKLLPGQGNLHFPITTSSPEAQKFFNQGVAQMHSFWSREAERSFLQAAALDPAAPMPHWGIAMVAAGDYRPGFQLDLIDGREPKPKKRNPAELRGGALRAVEAAEKAAKLAQVPGKANELEKLYIASVLARRDRTAKDPNIGYVQGLRTLLAKYPNEVEAKTFLALHIMSGFVLPERKPRKGTMEAVALLKEMMASAPDHPGVHHYVIHGFEGSTFARDAWPSCKRYAELSPQIAHALHMPGHIYAQTGKWDEAAQAFSTAADVELGYMKADSLHGSLHHGHNVHFLVTTYTFQNKYDEAVKAAQSLLAYKENPREAAQAFNPRTTYRQGWFSMLRTLVYFEKWDEILHGSLLPDFDKPAEQAWRHWARAIAQTAKGNIAAAHVEQKEMDAALNDLRAVTKRPVPEPLQVARQELDAHLALAAKDVKKSLKLFERAARSERSLHYNEPPLYPRPVYEVLGKVALQHNERALAQKAFEQALDQYPESVRARTGLAAVRGGGKNVDAGL